MKRLKVSTAPEEEPIAEAVECLREGKLVAFPTETVYGIGARLSDEAAVARLVKAGRADRVDSAFTVLVRDADQIKDWLASWGDEAETLTEKFWPGRLALQLEVADSFPIGKEHRAEDITFRSSKHPVPRALIKVLDEPIVACSAARHADLIPKSADDVIELFGKEALACVLDAGPGVPAIAPTMVSLAMQRKRLMRHGAIPEPAIAHYVGELEPDDYAPPIDFEARSDVGQKRKRNEDAMGRGTAPDGAELFVVADGMGGFDAGDVASRMAVAAALASWTHSVEGALGARLERAVKDANLAVHTKAMQLGFLDHMGTTIVMLAVQSDRAAIAHVGDSRMYRLRSGALQQVTEDHTEAQELVNKGKLSPEKADTHQLANVLTKCLGIEEKVVATVQDDVKLLASDTYLLCSDGLSGVVPEHDIEQSMRFMAPRDAVRRMIKMANDRGAPDNVTAMLIRYGAPSGPLEDAPSDFKPEGSGRRSGSARVALMLALVLAIAAVAAFFAMRGA